MTDTELQKAILHMDLILRVNAGLGASDPKKLTAALETACTEALNTGRGMNSAWLFAGGDVAGARVRVKEARNRIGDLIRNTQAYINSLPDEDVNPADKIDALESLGYAQGELGDLRDGAHVISLGDQIVAGNAGLPVAVQVPATIITRLVNHLAIYRANDAIAGGGSQQDITDDKNIARDTLLARIARVRLYIASTDDAGEYYAALALYNFQPRRNPGDAQPQPLPVAPGTAVLDQVARTLTIPEMPEHATSIVAWRQVAGGEPEECGISNTTTVGIADISPLTPGVTYTVWVTGRNSRDDGPPSNVITFTA